MCRKLLSGFNTAIFISTTFQIVLNSADANIRKDRVAYLVASSMIQLVGIYSLQVLNIYLIFHIFQTV